MAEAEESAPARDVQDDAVARHVVLNAHEVVVSPLVEDAAGRFGSEVVERHHADAAIRLIVGIVAVVEARPDIVVAANLGSVTVLVDL